MPRRMKPTDRRVPPVVSVDPKTPGAPNMVPEKKPKLKPKAMPKRY